MIPTSKDSTFPAGNGGGAAADGNDDDDDSNFGLFNSSCWVVQIYDYIMYHLDILYKDFWL